MSTVDYSPSNANAAFRSVFGARVGVERAKAILNILLESPFFYRDDNLDLFETLRRRKSVFADFVESFFGWELYVDNHVARLVKPKVFNSELKPTQRHIFRLSGRHEFILFVLLLEFHQRQADEQNIDLEKSDEVRFVLGDYFEFVFQRYRDESACEEPVTEEKIFETCRVLFKKLEQFRFIAVRQKQGRVKEQGLKYGFTDKGKDDVMYALLPGLRCYRAEALTQTDFDPSATADLESDAEDPETVTDGLSDELLAAPDDPGDEMAGAPNADSNGAVNE